MGGTGCPQMISRTFKIHTLVIIEHTSIMAVKYSSFCGNIKYDTFERPSQIIYMVFFKITF